MKSPFCHHATLTAFVSPIVAGRMLHLTPEAIQHAIGISGNAPTVFGGNQGLGLAIARAYVEAGAHVLISARDAALLKTAAGGGIALDLPIGNFTPGYHFDAIAARGLRARAVQRTPAGRLVISEDIARVVPSCAPRRRR